LQKWKRDTLKYVPLSEACIIEPLATANNIQSETLISVSADCLFRYVG
jgi:hypothetical protein